jgi:hypothetical protein
MTRTMDIDRALINPQALGAALGDPTTWACWLIVLRASFGLPLNDEQLQTFRAVSGGRDPPTKRVRELWAIIARRCGKSRMAAALGCYFALFMPYKAAPGERPMVLILAETTDQAKAVFEYALGFLRASPPLAREIASTTANEIRLRNGVSIAIHANSFRSVRSKTILAVVFDEISFWRDETSASPDTEVYRAVLPALATTGGMLVGISTPYRKAGLLYAKHKQYFGVDSNDTLVIQGTNKEFNTTLDEAAVAAQRLADPEGALAEWDAMFRNDISAFLDDDLIETSIDHGRPLELPPQRGISYFAYTDPSGGRGDAYTVCVGHRHSASGRLVVDVVRGKHMPYDAHSFDPMEATKEFAALLKQYHVTSVTGDAYAAEWVSGAWRAAGIAYRPADQVKSELYLEALPLFTRGLVSLPDHGATIRELRLLERHTHRSGKDSVDHGKSGHDDHANAVCGALVALSKRAYSLMDSPLYSDDPPPSDPKPFAHDAARDPNQEAREYWQGLAGQIHAYSGGRWWG